jgi:hypothetical protein
MTWSIPKTVACRAGIIAAILVGTGGFVEADESRAPLRMQLHLLNHAGVPADVLEAARTELTRIYGRAGFELVWDRRGAERPSTRVTVKIVSYLPQPNRAAPYVMGVTVKHSDGRLAYVVFNEVVAFSRAHNVDLSTLLAHVIAHEVGHVLLPTGAHSPTGVMRATWDRSQIRDAQNGDLTFTAEEIHTIRAAAQ